MPELASQPPAAVTAPRDGLPRPGRIPGNQAIWVGIFSEMSEFGIMFLAFFIAGAHYPVLFQEGPTQLNTTAGLVNTLVLLSSSYFVAKAMVAIRQERRTACLRWLWAAVGAAAAYLLVKYVEYEWNSAHGITIDTNAFFAVYYYMTFNHLLHVGWGGGAILWAIMRLKMGAYDAENHEGLEAVAVYWHMIDLAWIVMFPLVYVLR